MRAKLFKFYGTINSKEDIQKALSKQPESFWKNLRDSYFHREFFEHLKQVPTALVEHLNVPIIPKLVSKESRFYKTDKEAQLANLSVTFRTIAQTEHLCCVKCSDRLPVVRHKSRQTKANLLSSHSSSYQPKALQTCHCKALSVEVDSVGRLVVYVKELHQVTLESLLWIPKTSKFPGGFIVRSNNLGASPVLDIPLIEDIAKSSTESVVKRSLLDSPRLAIDAFSYNNHKYELTKFLSLRGVTKNLEPLVIPPFSFNRSSVFSDKDLRVSKRVLNRFREYLKEYSRNFKVIIASSYGLDLPSGVSIPIGSEFFKLHLQSLVPNTMGTIPYVVIGKLLEKLEELRVPILPLEPDLHHIVPRNSKTPSELVILSYRQFEDFLGYPKISLGYLPLYSEENSHGELIGNSKGLKFYPKMLNSWEINAHPKEVVDTLQGKFLVTQKGRPFLRNYPRFLPNLAKQKLLGLFLAQHSILRDTLENYKAVEDLLVNTEIYKVDFSSKAPEGKPKKNNKRLCLYSALWNRHIRNPDNYPNPLIVEPLRSSQLLQKLLAS